MDEIFKQLMIECISREKPETGHAGLFPVTVEIARTLPPVHPFSVWELRDYIHFLTPSIKLYRGKK